eukprot:scaffold921_cov126-Cylindrotheca_fusiformis.AAC.2
MSEAPPPNFLATGGEDIGKPISVASDTIGETSLKQSETGGAAWALPAKALKTQAEPIRPEPFLFQSHTNDFNKRMTEKEAQEDDSSDVPELIAEDSVDTFDNFKVDIAAHQHPMASVSLPFSAAFDQAFSRTQPEEADKKPSRIPKSCLKKRNTPRTGLPRTHRSSARRVRGIWSPKSPSYPIPPNFFEQLRDETILNIFSFLMSNPSDLLSISQVGLRFNYIIKTSKQLWKRIDATDFVEDLYERFNQSSVQTTRALGRLLLNYRPESVSIHNIGGKLSADESFLPPGGGRLKELTLTHFDELTDTHLHVMLLLLALSPQQQMTTANKKIEKTSTSLVKLSLEHCPRLTNATIRSISSSICCSSLQSLSLQGSSQVSDVLPLAPLFRTQAKPQMSATPFQAPSKATSSLAGLFGPAPSTSKPPAPVLQSFFEPPSKRAPSNRGPSDLASLFGPPPSQAPAPPRLQSLFDPPPQRPSSPPRTSDPLQALFAPPGTSPKKNVNNVPSASGYTSGYSRPPNSTVGSLQCLNLRGTGVTPKAWIQCCQEITASSTRLIHLRFFAMDGNEWTTPDLEKLSKMLALDDLQICHLPVSDAHIRSLLTLGAPDNTHLHFGVDDTCSCRIKV